MGQKLKDDTRQRLWEEYTTHDILDAIDIIDEIRGRFADRENYDEENGRLIEIRPPEIREQLMQLHTVAFDVISQGFSHESYDDDMFDLAMDIEWDLDQVIRDLQKVRKIVTKLTRLAPRDEDEDWEDDEN